MRSSELIIFGQILLSLVTISCGKQNKVGPSANPDFTTFGLEAGSVVLVRSAAPDFSSGSVAVFNQQSLSNFSEGIDPGVSDFFLSCYSNWYFKIDSYNLDRLTKFDILKPAVKLDQWSTLGNDLHSSAPHSLSSLRNDKAYLMGSNTNFIKIVNPMASDKNSFISHEINLDSYKDRDGSAEIGPSLIVGDKLFVFLQRLDRLDASGSWNPSNTNFVSVIDTKTDTEIDLNRDAVQKGLPLSIRNVISKPSILGKLMAIAGAGNLITSDGQYAGIEVFDLTSLNSVSLIGRGRQFKKVLFDRDGRLFALRFHYYGSLSLEIFQNHLGVESPLYGDLITIKNRNISDIGIDKNNVLWVLEEYPQSKVYRYDLKSGSQLLPEFKLKQSPQEIHFCP